MLEYFRPVWCWSAGVKVPSEGT